MREVSQMTRGIPFAKVEFENIGRPKGDDYLAYYWDFIDVENMVFKAFPMAEVVCDLDEAYTVLCVGINKFITITPLYNRQALNNLIDSYIRKEEGIKQNDK